MKTQQHISDRTDGVDVIGIGNHAATRTGRLLSLNGGIGFITVEHGQFTCFNAYYAYLLRRQMPEPIDRRYMEAMRTACGERADSMLASVIHRAHTIRNEELGEEYYHYLVHSVFNTPMRQRIFLDELDSIARSRSNRMMGPRLRHCFALHERDPDGEVTLSEAPPWMVDQIARLLVRLTNPKTRQQDHTLATA
jgi:hypothetical protein